MHGTPHYTLLYKWILYNIQFHFLDCSQIQGAVENEAQKRLVLSRQLEFNKKHCICCFSTFGLIFNKKVKCEVSANIWLSFRRKWSHRRGNDQLCWWGYIYIQRRPLFWSNAAMSSSSGICDDIYRGIHLYFFFLWCSILVANTKKLLIVIICTFLLINIPASFTRKFQILRQLFCCKSSCLLMKSLFSIHFPRRNWILFYRWTCP